MIKKGFKLLTILILMISIVGCGNKSMHKIVTTPGYLTDPDKVEALNGEVVDRLNSFGLDMYDALYKDNRNIFISPASIYLALGMTYNGASGNTALEMSEVLKSDDISLDDFNKGCRELQSLILGYEQNDFELANSIWLRDTYQKKINNKFISRNKDYFGAMIASLDFNDPKSINTINDWVKTNTKNKIEKAIEESSIDTDTVMFLINTIYFKANWETSFNKENTTDKDFKTPNGTKKVPMMNKIGELGYTDDEDLKGVLLPYKGGKTGMFVLVPKDDINTFSHQLNGAKLNNYIYNMLNNKASINLSMPKIRLEYSESLNEPLKSLGMIDAFGNNANFSGMADDDLYISKVKHKTFLSVDENGTEAAAMTSVEVNKESAIAFDYTVNVDKPFMLGIVDMESGAILFMGTVSNPQ